MKYVGKLNLMLALIVCLTAGVYQINAQSTDIDNPTALTGNVIDGEGDGKAETFYYSFTAMKGDVKVTVDARTDYYSVILDTALLDEDGRELLRIQDVATDVGKREVATRHFVRDQKVILRVTLPQDAHLKLLTYRIKLDGSVKVETPPAVVPVQASAAPVANPPSADPAAANVPPANGTVPVAAPAETAAPKTTLKDKIKAKIKKEVKKTVKENTPDE